jgi:hypothetical protein
VRKSTIANTVQSFYKVIDHFAQLVQTLTAETNYKPNEAELKVAALMVLVADLKAKNTAVTGATANPINTRIARDKVLYGEGVGIADIGKEVNNYVKSVYGVTSAQCKQVSGIRLT